MQTVIAGTKSAVDKAAQRLKENGAKRILPLAVSAAFHSELMKPAAGEFMKLISDFKFAEPAIPFYSNFTGEKRTDFSSMPSYLSAHICSPVLFTKELNTMKNDGFDVFIELGPGKVLTGLVKKTLSGVTALNIEDAGSLSKALEVLS